MPVDRQGVVDAAKYLRRVRPIDPAEIREYVTGTPHEGVVRQVLREEAWDLGLVEREDGSFVPVGDEPVTVWLDHVERVPDPYVGVVEDRLVERFGPEYARGSSGKTLRETIRRLKERYYHQHPVEYDLDAALGYAIYHLADYYAVGQYLTAELAAHDLVPRKIRVLDVGAGIGGPALGLADLLPDDCLVDYHAVEPSAAAGLLRAFLAETGRNFHWTVHEETAEEFTPDAYDLVICANVLSELADPTPVARKYLEATREDGTFLAIAPADRNTSIQLREIERDLEAGGATVWGPTVRLWPDERPTDRGWSFDERPDVEVPAPMQRLANAAQRPSEFLNTDVKYSWTALRHDEERRIQLQLTPDRFAKLADSERHVTDRVDLVAAKLSHNLADQDANPLYKVSDGSERTEHYAVHVRETSLNRPLATAEYGDVLHFEQVLVLWNDDEGAYNLVVDQDTVVDRYI